jgi:hypothetical protein
MGQRDSIKKTGTADGYRTDRGNATLITEPVIGIVKNNIDPTHSGRVYVYISTFGGQDPDSKDSWIPVRYMSPFIGVTSYSGDPKDGPDKSGYGKFVGNPQSYGFWASSPDIGTEVVCIFANGRVDQGFYIGCIPPIGMLSMTPAIAASSEVVPNSTEATTYGGADRLPTTEINAGNPTLRNSPTVYLAPKPIHSYQASILAQQGLLRDNIRGVISSSAQRESPSRVFGISTPGGPIFEGGYTSATIQSAVKKENKEKLRTIGRTGGHTFVMDDGTLTGQDQLIRLRSSAGHQITMSDTGQTLFIIHSNGQSWIEMGKEGTIDIYSTNSFNVRTQGDLNLHADNNVNIQAGKNLNINADKINIETAGDFKVRTGASFSGYAEGSFTFKTTETISLQTGGEIGITAGGVAAIVGSKVNLNSGAGPQAPDVPAQSRTNHIDTSYTTEKGWITPSPQELISVVSRAPAHQPWVGSGTGVNVTVKAVAPTQSEQTTPAVDTANAASPATPPAPVTQAEVASAPASTSGAGPLTAPAVQAVSAQQAASTQALSGAQQAAAGVVNQVTGVTAKIAEAAGAVAPGSGDLSASLIAKGMPIAKAFESTVSGASGIASATELVKNVAAQNSLVQTAIVKSAEGLQAAGILTGKESPAQAGGPIMAAVAMGVDTVAGLLKGGASAIGGALNSVVSGVVGTLGSNLAAGKLAGGLADAVSSGIGGLKTSLSGLATKVGAVISNPLDKLKSGLQTAFDAVKDSFPALKGGVPNVLGNATQPPEAPKSAMTQAAETYDIAQAAAASAQDAVLEAKRDYRNNPKDPEAYEKLQAAESALSSARQKVSQASTAFLKASPGGALLPTVDQLSGLASKVSSTLTSGLNALPGGIGSMVSSVSGALAGASNPIAPLIGVATSLVGSVGAGVSSAVTALSDPKKLVGDLVGKTTESVKSLLGGGLPSLPSIPGLPSLPSIPGLPSLPSIPGLSNLAGLAGGKSPLDIAKAGAAGIMGQLETSLSSVGDAPGQIKAAINAVGTFDKTAILAKTGQLLGDSKIPVPSFSGTITIDANSDPNKVSAEVTTALDEVTDAQNRVRNSKLNVSLTLRTGNEESIAKAKQGLTDEEAKLRLAQAAYASIVSSTQG